MSPDEQEGVRGDGIVTTAAVALLTTVAYDLAANRSVMVDNFKDGYAAASELSMNECQNIHGGTGTLADDIGYALGAIYGAAVENFLQDNANQGDGSSLSDPRWLRRG